MSNLIKIIRYFFYHDISSEMVERVHKRLSVSGDEKEKEQIFQALWDETGFPEISSEQTRQAFSRVEQRLGVVHSLDKKKRLSIPRISLWLRITAIWLIPLLSLSAAFHFYRETKLVKDSVAKVSFVEHYVPSGKREQVILPDSSKVWLNSGTLLIYPSVFVGDAREVYLSGEGYFDVRKSETNHFIVKTNTLSVEVLGTKFNLSAYPEAEKISATLEQGAVKVLLNDSGRAGGSFFLKPNEQLVLIQATGKIEQLNVKAKNYSDWKEGGLLFRNSSFKDILKTLERVYSINVQTESSAYNENHLTIHFNKDESLENVMMLMKEMIPGLEYKIEGNRLYVK